jgi:Domain of unknown function (DUF1877)
MGVTLHLKMISASMLEILKQEPKQVRLFYDSQYLTKSAVNSSFVVSTYVDRFIDEWETPDLDLHKYYPEMTYLLGGYLEDYSERHLALPELQSRQDLMQKDRYMNFLIIEESEWDGLPLVNAINVGIGIGQEEDCCWYQTPEEVGQILDGLIWISESGFRSRCHKVADLDGFDDWFDWEDTEDMEDMEYCLTDYYREMVKYYQYAVRNGNAMLIEISY